MLMFRYPFSGVGAEGASASPKIFICQKFGKIPENSGTQVSTPLFSIE